MRNILLVNIKTEAFKEARQSLEPFIENVTTRTKKDLEKAAEEKVEKQAKMLQQAIYSPLASRVIAIGLGFAEINDTADVNSFDTRPDLIRYQVLTYAEGVENPEADLIQRFMVIAKNYGNEYVTFNGREYDFPYLVFRAAINSIPLTLPTYYKNTFDGHFDLAQYLFKMSLVENIDNNCRGVYMNQWIRWFGFQPIKRETIPASEIGYIVDGLEDNLYVMWNLFKMFKHTFEGRFSR